MPSERLVRCEVTRPGSEGSGSTRYVPAEIFGLWTYLMEKKHSFEVRNQEASIWEDVEEKPEAAYSETQYDRVVEITLLSTRRRTRCLTGFEGICRWRITRDSRRYCFPTTSRTRAAGDCVLK